MTGAGVAPAAATTDSFEVCRLRVFLQMFAEDRVFLQMFAEVVEKVEPVFTIVELHWKIDTVHAISFLLRRAVAQQLEDGKGCVSYMMRPMKSFGEGLKYSQRDLMSMASLSISTSCDTWMPLMSKNSIQAASWNTGSSCCRLPGLNPVSLLKSLMSSTQSCACCSLTTSFIGSFSGGRFCGDGGGGAERHPLLCVRV
jgi:hypothetical protein